MTSRIIKSDVINSSSQDSITLEYIGLSNSNSDESKSVDNFLESKKTAKAIRYRQVRDRHWFMLRLSLFVIACSFFFQIGEAGRISPSGFANLPMPSLCASRSVFGVECPGCGLTRSFVALAHGDLGTSLGFHRVGWLLAIAVIAQIPYRIYALRQIRFNFVERIWPIWFGRALILILLINWFIKISFG